MRVSGAYVLSAVLVALPLLATARPAAERNAIVREGRPAGCIVIPEGTEKGCVLRAATALSGYLKEMTGAAVPVRWDSDECTGFRILVGSTRLAPVRAAEVADGRVGYDGFIVRSVRNGLVIAGRTPAGTANGVYDFAENVLGIHWFTIADAGPTIPTRQTVTVPDLHLVSKPDFAVRAEYYTINLNYLAADQKARIAGWQEFNRVGGIEAHHYHALYVFCPDALYAEHPEYFPLIDGKRTPGHEHVQRCLSNPDVLALAVDYSARTLEGQPGLAFTSLSPDDGYGWCQCDACRALGPTPAAQMLEFVNRVAAALEKRLPGRGFLFYAYMATIEPPAGMKVHPNVRPVIAPIHECNIHPLSSDCPDRVKLRRVVDGWAKMAGAFGWYPYLNGGVFTTPGVMMIADEMRYVHSRGCFMSFREHTCAPGVGWPLLAWVEAKLMWDVDQDVGRLRREFIEAYYGKPAADSLERAFATIEAGLVASPTALPERYDGPNPHKFWPFDKLRPYIQPALPDLQAALGLAAAQPEPQRSRILTDTKALLGDLEIVPP
jgi:hypothetical protein